MEADWELIDRARTDSTAFGVLYDRYLDRIYRFIYVRVHERSLAEDITEEVFFKALKNIKNYHDLGASFSAWLYTIAGHAIADHYRRRCRQAELGSGGHQSASAELVLDLVVKRDEQRRVWEAIDQLPRHQRTAMILKFSADLSNDDVARLMHKTTAAAKLLVHRAVQRLRLELVPEST